MGNLARGSVGIQFTSSCADRLSNKRTLNSLRVETCGFDFFFGFLHEVKRELKRIYINGCRYNERLNAKTEGSKRLGYTGLRGSDK